MADFDYVVVGSGAGGGPLAANLARRGFQVLVVEAGGDACAASELGRFMYQVPIFHAHASEFPGSSWDYFVRHYADEEQQRRNSKYDPEGGGIWYPRAGTLGGCTATNAMITVTPQALDWDLIADITGDETWRPDEMQKYFARLEDARYVPRPGSFLYLLSTLVESVRRLGGRGTAGSAAHGHGFRGWLTTSEADPFLVLPDPSLRKLLWDTLVVAFEKRVGSLFSRALTGFDPNDVRNCKNSPEGIALTPLAVARGQRNGPREYLLRTREEFPHNLTIALDTLVSRVIFEGTRATGVEVLEGAHLYEADPAARRDGRPHHPRRRIRARREVILAAGAFNTPQILKLSGVGPAEELARLGIPIVVDLPGVGENLQDRYEVCVVSEFKRPFSMFAGATFAPPVPGAPGDSFLGEWERQRRGIYTSNGSLIGLLKRSSPDLPEPDLYIFGLPGDFRGHRRGYSGDLGRYGNRFTWAVLKAYTKNHAGRVTLRSNDPTVRPRIDFHHFAEGSEGSGADLDAIVRGVELARDLNRSLGSEIDAELYPGPQWDTREKLRAFVQNEAWGHHASCSCPIGADSDPGAVLDSQFRVRGVQGLRVVDASVFPRIPGYFIVSAIYMIGEKASDVIAEAAGQSVS